MAWWPRDKREEQDSRDVCALSLPIALFPLGAPVLLESASAIGQKHS